MRFKLYNPEEYIYSKTIKENQRILYLQKSQKRAMEATAPTTPANKMRQTQNGPTPVSHKNGTTPTNGHAHNSLPTTPYSHKSEIR